MRHRHAVSFVILAILAAVGPAAVAHAQPAVLSHNAWVTNGPVYAMARHGSVLYLGGAFSWISPATGGGVPIDPQTATAMPSFPPVVGQVYVVAPDLNGGWYIGGLFSAVGGQARSNVAHITSAGAVSAWNPGAKQAVMAIHPSLTGTVFVGGSFTSIGGQTRLRLAEIDASGAATAWNPSPNGSVMALGISGTTVFVGGQFTFVGATQRANLAAVHATTGALTTWNPGCNGSVYAIEVAIRGTPQAPVTTVLVGGSFSTIAGNTRLNLGELRLDGTATAWNPNPNGAVHDIHEKSPVVYVGGAFSNIAGLPRNYVAAINPATAQATAFDPNANGIVRAIQWSASSIFLGGQFTTIGGSPRNYLAKVDESGVPHLWEPNPNGPVRSLVIGAGALYVGGDYTGLGGVPRANAAAFDLDSHEVTDWAPEVTGSVLAMAPYAVGPSLYKLYVGGEFSSVNGQPRSRLAELDPETGAVRPWSPSVDGTVWCMALNDTSLFVGGSFLNIGVHSRSRLAEFDRRTGVLTNFFAFFNNTVHAVAFGPSKVYVGGAFTTASGQTRNHLAALEYRTGDVDDWNPNANATVRALHVHSPLVYMGGDFTTVGGQPRNRLAAVGLGASVNPPEPWNPDANGVVRALVAGGTGFFAGGDFTTVSGQPRGKIANFEILTGALEPWDPQIADREVWSLAAHGAGVYAGGSFSGVGTAAHGNLALFRPTPLLWCLPSPLMSPGGPAPRGVVTGDFDNDGIRDLVTLSEKTHPQSNAEATVLRGNGSGGVGDGMFTAAQSLPLPLRPMHAAVADFDADGREDLAISITGTTGEVWVYRNEGGTFGTPSLFPVYGRSDGIAAGDLDNDGILDLVVCLTDSASTPGRGGLLVLRGGGTGGVWNGDFTIGPKFPARAAFARRVLPADMDGDGVLDLLYVGNSPSGNFVRLLPNLGQGCYTVSQQIPTPGEPGSAVVSGDFTGDGVPDISVMANRFVNIMRTELYPGGCTFIPRDQSLIELPSSGRDMVALDFTLDGILDLAVSMDSIETVHVYPGQSDGTFGPPIEFPNIEAWGLAAGDFVANGSPDLVVTNRDCTTVTVIDQSTSPLLATNLDLVTPNGGENWPAFLAPPPAGEESIPWVLEDGLGAGAAAGTSPAILASPGDAPRLDGAQQITWTKGPGVMGVDVQLSRNGGTTWQTIGANRSGTAMTWLVTPPGTLDARVRVRDALVPARADAGDGAFQIPSGTVGVEPGSPGAIAFRMLDGNPARGAVRFRLDLPREAEVEVAVYDVAGRRVRELTRGSMPSGTHDLSWDVRSAGGAPGVYFVRARIGAKELVRKTVIAG